MFLSVFDIFKLGIGPSSSHTMGPMVAAGRFLDLLRNGADRIPGAGEAARLGARLHGSLAFTGKGHATDRAVILGLAGFEPESFDALRAATVLSRIRETGRIAPPGLPEMDFDPEADLVFDYGPALPGHANGLVISARDAAGNLYLEETYYSVGGGFVLTARELEAPAASTEAAAVPFPFGSCAEMLELATASGRSIAEMQRANEVVHHGPEALDSGLARIWEAMAACIDRGLAGEGILPGGLKMRRRARAIHERLMAERGRNLAAPHTVNDWIAVYAIAVNEENAEGTQVVTAPTNGASGVVPGVLRYWLDHVPGASPAGIPDFLLTAAAIGGVV